MVAEFGSLEALCELDYSVRSGSGIPERPEIPHGIRCGDYKPVQVVEE